MAKFFIGKRGAKITLHVKQADRVIAHGMASNKAEWDALRERCQAQLSRVRGSQLFLFKTGQVNSEQEVTDERG